MAKARIRAFDRWLALTIQIPHNGEVTRPQIPGAVFSCEDVQARYLTRECFATYCLPDGTPCGEAEASIPLEPPLSPIDVSGEELVGSSEIEENSLEAELDATQESGETEGSISTEQSSDRTIDADLKIEADATQESSDSTIEGDDLKTELDTTQASGDSTIDTETSESENPPAELGRMTHTQVADKTTEAVKKPASESSKKRRPAKTEETGARCL